jgi:hypothetical protein
MMNNPTRAQARTINALVRAINFDALAGLYVPTKIGKLTAEQVLELCITMQAKDAGYCTEVSVQVARYIPISAWSAELVTAALECDLFDFLGGAS